MLLITETCFFFDPLLADPETSNSQPPPDYYLAARHLQRPKELSLLTVVFHLMTYASSKRRSESPASPPPPPVRLIMPTVIFYVYGDSAKPLASIFNLLARHGVRWVHFAEEHAKNMRGTVILGPHRSTMNPTVTVILLSQETIFIYHSPPLFS